MPTAWNEAHATDGTGAEVSRPVSADTSPPVKPDPWAFLRRYTDARNALGRVGSSQPTQTLLDFRLAHALARDAVHRPLDVTTLFAQLTIFDLPMWSISSNAPDRATYLQRPDLGRELTLSATRDLAAESIVTAGCDVAFVIADGLSSLAVERHAPALLAAALPALHAAERWHIGPLVVARQARVALGDAVGHALNAELVVVLIGERPGLSSPDSLGAYLTYAPRPGRSNAERNCISNIRPEGLACDAAARKLVYLLLEARRRGLTGIHLKDDAPRLLADDASPRDDTSMI